MKPLKLYSVEAEDGSQTIIAARSNDQAAEIFITKESAEDRLPGSFTVERVFFGSFSPEHQAQLRGAVNADREGIARFDEESGWSIDSEGWTSFDSSEEVR